VPALVSPGAARLRRAGRGYLRKMRRSSTGTLSRPRTGLRPPFSLHGTLGTQPVVATAIHAGHDVRDEVARHLALAEADRLREEDPHTDRIIASFDTRAVVHRSRFEVDLNRARDEAVYSADDETWGLDTWKRPLSDAAVERSLAIHDEFYARLGALLDRLAERGPFVLLDVHSYNHRRGGPQAPPDDPAANPDLNVGTGSLDRARWGPAVDALIDACNGVEVAGRPLDVRENVRFEGAHLAAWVHDRYPDTGCALALEFKKTFMDEWTGDVDRAHLRQLGETLHRAVPSLVDALDQVTGGARR
jgi:N-formylglutamate amidohydrolase